MLLQRGNGVVREEIRLMTEIASQQIGRKECSPGQSCSLDFVTLMDHLLKHPRLTCCLC